MSLDQNVSINASIGGGSDMSLPGPGWAGLAQRGGAQAAAGAISYCVSAEPFRALIRDSAIAAK